MAALAGAGVFGWLKLQQARRENETLKEKAEKAEQQAETAKKFLKPPRVAVVIPFAGDDFSWMIRRGANRAAADLAKEDINIRVIPQAPVKPEPGELERLLEVILPYLDGLALGSYVDTKLAETFKKAREQRLPIVLIGRFDPSSESQVLKQIASDPASGGRLAPEHLLSMLDKEGKPAAKIILLRFQRGVELTDNREQGFLDVLNKRIEEQKKAGKPTLTILSSDKYAGVNLENATRTAQALLQQFGGQQIDVIGTSQVPSTLAVLNAVRQQALAGKVKVIGFDESLELIRAVGAGEVHGLVISDPFQIGYLGVWLLGQQLAGKEVQPAVKKLSVEQLVVTKEKLEKPEVGPS
jgi:ribose transport system substrate-binding protein